MAQFIPQEASKSNPWALLAQTAERKPMQTNKAANEAITGLLQKADEGIRDTYDAAAARAAEQEKEYLKRSKPVTEAADKASTLITETKEQTKEALNAAGIEDFSLETTKKLVKEGGEAIVPAIKDGIKFAKGFFGDTAPDTMAEGVGTVLAAPTPKLTKEEQQQVVKQGREEYTDAQKTVAVLEKSDPNTEEGKNAWQRTADLLGVPLEYLRNSWDAFDEATGGYAKGVTGLLGDAGGAIAEGASFLNDKVDFITMLAVGAQAATQTNNVGVAVLKGLAGGVQARQQQKAAAAKQAREDAKWAAEQNVREYNALTNRNRQEASLLDKENKPLELSTSDRSIAKSYAADNKVSQSVVEDAIIRLKAVKQPITPTTIQNAIKQGVASGAYDEPMLFGKTTLMD
ncbi:hypothetical protein Q21_gp15 [Vibrio phage VPp1]|nr:hypothetical protein Q21_gp15 [Vibrio phage VPp1]